MKAAFLAVLFVFPMAVAQPSPSLRVVANGIGPVPGALICPSEMAIQELFYEYASYEEIEMRAVLTRGQSIQMDGVPMKPRVVQYGCTLIPPGTPMEVVEIRPSAQVAAAIARATVRLKNGHLIHGVTQTNMYHGRP